MNFLYKYYAIIIMHLRRGQTGFYNSYTSYFIFMLPLLNEYIVFGR